MPYTEQQKQRLAAYIVLGGNTGRVVTWFDTLNDNQQDAVVNYFKADFIARRDSEIQKRQAITSAMTDDELMDG